MVDVLKRWREKINEKFFIYLFFVIVATLLWFLNALGRNYNGHVDVAVRYINFPKDKIIVGNLPKEFSLKVNSDGYTLLKYKLSKALIPVTFDLNAYNTRILAGSSTPKLFILTRFAKESISNQVGSDMEVLEISPDSIVFEYTDVVNKKVMIEPDINISYAQQYMVNGEITSTPDSITISGPEPVLDTIESIATKEISLTDVNQTVNKEVSLLIPDKILSAVKKVKVHIPVEKFTQASFTIPVEVENLPDSLKLKLFPSKIKVSCNVALSNYVKLQPELFQAVVDYNDIEKAENNRIRVEVTRSPSFISALNYYPQSLEFILEK